LLFRAIFASHMLMLITPFTMLAAAIIFALMQLLYFDACHLSPFAVAMATPFFIYAATS